MFSFGKIIFKGMPGMPAPVPTSSNVFPSNQSPGGMLPPCCEAILSDLIKSWSLIFAQPEIAVRLNVLENSSINLW